MEWLAERIHAVYAMEAPELLGDPWEARNAYGRVVAGAESPEDFLRDRMGPDASQEDQSQALRLLEMEEQALRLFTSCGWFFDDLAGLEARQILKYADRALELLGDEKHEADAGFLARLRMAPSNETPPGDGATLFREEREIRTLIRAWTPEATMRNGAPKKDTMEDLLSTSMENAVYRLWELVRPERGAPDGASIMEVLLDVKRLAYFHNRMNLPIPFNAQTDLFRAYGAAPANLRRAIAALHPLLGFTAEDA